LNRLVRQSSTVHTGQSKGQHTRYTYCATDVSADTWCMSKALCLHIRPTAHGDEL
jgi:hypothetical protein